VGDRLDLHRIGHDHARNIRAQDANYRHRVPGRLDYNFVILTQAAAEAFQAGTRHIDPAR